MSQSDQQLQLLIKRLEAATARLEGLTGLKTNATNSEESRVPQDEELSQSVKEFDVFITENIQKFMEISSATNDLVIQQPLSINSFMGALTKPVMELAKQVTEIKDSNRPSKFFNHLSCVAEGFPAVGWFVVEPTPASYIKDMRESAQFYSNRIMKEYKDVDKMQVEWASCFLNVLDALHKYVKAHHTTGLVWNAKGDEAKIEDFVAPGPPPPPPGPVPIFSAPAPSNNNAPDMTNLFAELNKGDLVTKGLRKVDKSEMTHKNPNLRSTSVVKAENKQNESLSPKINETTKPARIELEGNKWFIIGNENIIISETEIKNVINIYNCSNSVIQVKNKVNAISAVNCKKVAIVADQIVSTVEIVNSKGMQIQILGKCPTISVDKTDGTSLDTEILSAKCSELNVSLPGANDDDDLIEKPVPEQFKTIIKNGKLETTPVEHSGA
ncbi:Cyclase-associated/septum formation inhibitor domain-containing protein [Rozella allomycis CSF55]|uniref:Adenylyl cyclase-associated protein n=1 Tax=Rozella allomycis (strain CSF55) TaxID=988480 RepID=A0A075AN11_ROZAC|nr:Cyclase-associated/septum formation inhibitor domain-containing protein [Rozella allomycis CSF55]|eukprot:EPZ31126.1 Cyclase-associated/septum formation inhibitor domain-containing protein [Rozella allomycis CSF55]